MFVAYSGCWLSYGLLVQFFVGDVVAAAGDPASIVGRCLLAWAIVTAYMMLASVRTTRTALAIFVLLTAVSYLAAFGSFTGSTGLSELGLRARRGRGAGAPPPSLHQRQGDLGPDGAAPLAT